MAKATDIRPKITMACVECKERNYITRKRDLGANVTAASHLRSLFSVGETRPIA